VVKNCLYTLSKENLIQVMGGTEDDLTVDNLQGAAPGWSQSRFEFTEIGQPYSA
jgi:hypothetical protein